MTTLEEYLPQALTTMEPRSQDLGYLLPGLVGEMGELFGEYAKEVRKGEDRSGLVVLEYGDVAWMTAGLVAVLEMDPKAVEEHHALFDPPGSLEAGLELLLNRVAGVYRGGAALPLRVSALWVTLRDLCQDLTGASWSDVLDRNLEKLEARHG